MKQFIICPNCGAIELATIEETVPFWSYIHNCTKCDYIIMESEWNTAKAISIKQPWGYLIASGVKDIENRTWKTKFRGRILLHSGAKVDNRQMIELFTVDQWYSFFPSDKTEYMLERKWQTSAIIGSVEIVDCVQNHPSIWAEEGVWNWVLANPILFKKPILNVKGKLSFFIPQLPENV